MRFLRSLVAVSLLLALPGCKQLAKAWLAQASKSEQKGAYDQAIQSYDKAIRLDPTSAAAFNGRGYDYFAKGDYNHAIQDFTHALSLNPKVARALLNRGIANIYAGRFPEAQQDLSQNVQLDPKDPYAAMWLYLARAKGGMDGKNELTTNAATFDLSKWPGPVIQLYLDQDTPEAVLRAAGDDASQKCEYAFYVGNYRALRGERPEALALFSQASHGCARDFIEYVPAVIELNRLEKK